MQASFVVVVLNDRLITDVAEQIGDEYFKVGVDLNVPIWVIEQKEDQFPCNTMRVMVAVLSYWRSNANQRRDPTAMVKELCDTLRHNKHNDIVDYIEHNSE